MKRYLIILLFLTSIAGIAQVSYSDLYKLLEARKYDEAEPLLRKHLTEVKMKNPSALIFMGNMFYERGLEELLTENETRTRLFLDSARYYYEKALSTISDENFKGREKYYRAFVKTKPKKITVEMVKEDVSEQLNKIEKKLHRIRKSEQKNDSLMAIEAKRQGKYYALIIGVSTYNNSKLNLDRPVKDALKFKETITTHYTFDNNRITTLNNPTRQQIIKELYQLRKKVGHKDNLLIFFAGHGYWDEAAKQGYWWPRDATAEDPSQWLSNSDLKEQIRGIPSSHTLVISDACFSGAIFKTRSANEIKSAPLDILMLNRQPSRRAMTSGTLTTVPDQSVFFSYLIKQLKENTEKFTPSQSLFDTIRQKVIANSLIVPQDGVISETGDEGGDFIFIRKN